MYASSKLIITITDAKDAYDAELKSARQLQTLQTELRLLQGRDSHEMSTDVSAQKKLSMSEIVKTMEALFDARLQSQNQTNINTMEAMFDERFAVIEGRIEEITAACRVDLQSARLGVNQRDSGIKFCIIASTGVG